MMSTMGKEEKEEGERGRGVGVGVSEWESGRVRATRSTMGVCNE